MLTFFCISCLLISSIFSFDYYNSVQEGFEAGDCMKQNIAPLNDELAREWNCIAPNSLKYAGDIPHVEWGDDAVPYLQPRLYNVVREIAHIIFEESNIERDYLLPDKHLFPLLLFRGYFPAPTSEAMAYFYANKMCNVTEKQMSNPVRGLHEMGNAFLLASHNYKHMDVLSIWKDISVLKQGLPIYIPCDEATCGWPNHQLRFKYYIQCQFPLTRIIQLPCWDPADGGRLYFDYLDGYYGYTQHFRSFSNLAQAFGLQYGIYNVGEKARMILPETGVTDNLPKVCTVQRFTSTGVPLVEPDVACPYKIMTVNPYTLSDPVVNVSLNTIAFKQYWNHYNPDNQIASADSNIFDADTQSKLLHDVPPRGYGLATCERTCSPSQKLDLVFIIDGSGSLTRTNYDKELAFFVNVTSQLPIGQNDVRVGLIVFSTDVEHVYNLNYFQNTSQIAARVKRAYLPYPNGWTYTGKAFIEARAMLTSAERGARGVDVPKLIVIVTDGESNDRNRAAYTEAAKNHELGFNVVAIGIGYRGYSVDELNFFATDPDSQNVHALSNFDLSVINKRIQVQACLAPAKIYNTEIEFTATGMEDVFKRYEFLTAEEIYILYIQTDGSVMIYLNYVPTGTIPDSYQYDIAYNCTQGSPCYIAIPPTPVNWMNPSGSKRAVYGVPAGTKVPMTVEFVGKNLKREGETEMSFTLKKIPYEENLVTPPAVEPEKLVDVIPTPTTKEIYEYQLETYETLVVQGDTTAEKPVYVPDDPDDDNKDDDDVTPDDNIVEQEENRAQNDSPLVYGSTFGGVALLAVVIAGILVRQHANKTARIRSNDKEPEMCPVVGSVLVVEKEDHIVPEVTIPTIIPTVTTAPNQSTVKRLNSIQYLNEMAEKN